MEQEMRYIWQVWQEGSFSRAAEKLYMTQPALSIAVKRVEAGLGAELFDRSRHPLELTQAGQAYIETIRRVRYLEEELERQIEDLRGLRTGRVRRVLLPQAGLLSAWRSAYPSASRGKLTSGSLQNRVFSSLKA